MLDRMKGTVHRILATLLLMLAIGCERQATPPATQPATPPAQPPAAEPATAAQADTPAPRQAVATFIDLVRTRHPRFPADEPTSSILKFAESARIVLDCPVYLDNRRDLWITHPDAPPLADTLAAAAGEQVHIVPERIVYVRWLTDETGQWAPTLIARTADGRFEAITTRQQGRGPRARRTEQRTPLPDRDYLWHLAFDWQDAIAVPTSTGAAIVRPSPQWEEAYFDFAAEGLIAPASAAWAASATQPTTTPTTAPLSNPPQLLEDARGLLAFIPWDDAAPGSTRIARYIDRQWQILPPERDGERIVHLIPLLDGSLLRLAQGDEPGAIRLAHSLLETVDLPRDTILALVDQLSADLPDQREAAFNALQQYGQGVWPLLEEIADQQPPEARLRLRQLLRNRIAPTLGGMRIIADRLRVIARQPDRTVLLYAPQGVTIPGPQDQTFTLSPAWIATGPGTGIQLLPQHMTHDLHPDQMRIQWVTGDWIATDAARGPRMWVGNAFEPLLGQTHATTYRHVMGVDRQFRWLFAARPIATGQLEPGESFLILDRRLPDPTPRLPVWVWDGAEMGWDEQGYPGMRSGGAFVLADDAWRNLNGDTERFYTSPADARPLPPDPPATTQMPDDLGPPLLTDPDGATYFGGRDELIALRADGRLIRWTLPPNAVGQADVTIHLARTPDGRLFLYNQRGRLLRIAPTPDEPQPFTVEAAFTRNIPNVPAPLRLWTDPAGRLCLLATPTRLALCFPEGRIPRPISLLMPGGAEEEW